MALGMAGNEKNICVHGDCFFMLVLGCRGDDISMPALSSAKVITVFSLNGVDGTINETEKTIAVTMFSGTDVKALIATFTTTGTSVKVGSTVQISGITTNNFTSSVTYTVTAADASTQDYIVTVKVAPPLYQYILKWFWTNWNKY